MLLLRESDQALRESQNDVATTALLVEGWVDVTGVAEFEARCTKEIHPTLLPGAWLNDASSKKE